MAEDNAGTRWGVYYRKVVTEYASFDEATRQLALAQMDVPAELVYLSDGVWLSWESDRPVDVPMELDKAVEEIHNLVGHLNDEQRCSVYRVLDVVGDVQRLVESRKVFAEVKKLQAKRATGRGDDDLVVAYERLARGAEREIVRLERILKGGD